MNFLPAQDNYARHMPITMARGFQIGYHLDVYWDRLNVRSFAAGWRSSHRGCRRMMLQSDGHKRFTGNEVSKV